MVKYTLPKLLLSERRRQNVSEPTLVILAAGLSTRYGSPKQIDPVGPNGEFIII